MKLASPGQMAAIDAYTINELGIPGIVLMENAALKVVEETRKMLGNLKRSNILLLAGKGNNGGDAFAAARHLFNMGAEVKVYIVADATGIKGDSAVNLNAARKMGINIVDSLVNPPPDKHLACENTLARLKEDIEKADLIIDGIFGTGFRGEITGIVRDVVELLNRLSTNKILAIDIPSGVNGETGSVTGPCVKAAKTVTFCLPKIGLIVHPGCDYTGELVIADIGIPSLAVEKQNIKYNLIERSMVSAIIPERKAGTNKGSYGRVMLISGSTGMTGSGCLCAEAALRAGAGLVYLGVPASLSSIYSCVLKEPVIIPLEDAGTGRLTGLCRPTLLDRLEKMDAVAIGPGLSTSDGVDEIVYSVIESCKVPLVIDADALNIISKDVSVLKKLKAPAVITPHPGEMARLLKKEIGEIQDGRINAATGFAAEWNVTVVLKGSRTVIALPDGQVYINTGGNPGMATGGTGDVLTGIIAGLAGQGIPPEAAAIAGVYLHSAAGDAAADRLGMYGMKAGDLLDELAYAIRDLHYNL